jgi:hypothetical protein
MPAHTVHHQKPHPIINGAQAVESFLAWSSGWCFWNNGRGSCEDVLSTSVRDIHRTTYVGSAMPVGRHMIDDLRTNGREGSPGVALQLAGAEGVHRNEGSMRTMCQPRVPVSQMGERSRAVGVCNRVSPGEFVL